MGGQDLGKLRIRAVSVFVFARYACTVEIPEVALCGMPWERNCGHERVAFSPLDLITIFNGGTFAQNRKDYVGRSHGSCIPVVSRSFILLHGFEKIRKSMRAAGYSQDKLEVLYFANRISSSAQCLYKA